MTSERQPPGATVGNNKIIMVDAETSGETSPLLGAGADDRGANGNDSGCTTSGSKDAWAQDFDGLPWYKRPSVRSSLLLCFLPGRAGAPCRTPRTTAAFAVLDFGCGRKGKEN